MTVNEDERVARVALPSRLTKYKCHVRISPLLFTSVLFCVPAKKGSKIWLVLTSLRFTFPVSQERDLPKYGKQIFVIPFPHFCCGHRFILNSNVFQIS